MLYMCRVTAVIKKLLVLHLIYLSISGHPSVSLKECPFLSLWCNFHLFLCDGITIWLSVTTVICISVTASTFFTMTTIFYFSVTEHPSVCLWRNIHIFVFERTSCFSMIQHPLLQTKAFCVSLNHLFSVSDFNWVIVM